MIILPPTAKTDRLLPPKQLLPRWLCPRWCTVVVSCPDSLLVLTVLGAEARLSQASLLKKIIEALKDLVTDANWDVNENGITLQVGSSALRSARSL
jgi:hypothetical protein